ncbi:MAG: hypothetical protein PUB70_08435 [Bacteroidales bacterium]|nr:hypothetical protein [Bacteroidales bacterium]
METPEISRIYALIPDSGLEIQNRCMETPEISRIYALIHDSGPEIKNQCTKEGGNGEDRAGHPQHAFIR